MTSTMNLQVLEPWRTDPVGFHVVAPSVTLVSIILYLDYRHHYCVIYASTLVLMGLKGYLTLFPWLFC